MESPIVAIVLFLLFVFAATQLIMITTSNLNKIDASITANSERSIEEKSNMEITSINCTEPDLNVTTVYIKNIGKKKLHMDKVDVFFDDRFPRNDSNRTIGIDPADDILDPGLWNPKEEAKVTLYKQLASSTNYTFIISNEFGVTASIKCST